MCLHKLDECFQSARQHLRIRVQQEYVTPDALLDRLVVALGKADVFSILDEPDLRKAAAHRRRAAIVDALLPRAPRSWQVS
jgi:hypothetical protein